ncbi:MAG: hypothetical protein ACXWM6_16220, partial [Thermodesulfobacteriota bacterium]
HPLLLTILRPGIIITCMLGFHIHSGVVGSGSPDSSVSTIFTEGSLPMGTVDLFQTISGIQGRGDSVQLILQEDIWEMPWRIYPIRQEHSVPVKPAMVHLQS